MAIQSTGDLDTLEACQRRLMELIESARQKGAPPDEPINIEPVAKDLAQVYLRMGDLLLEGKDFENAAQCYAAVSQMNPQVFTTDAGLLKYKEFLTALLTQQQNDINLLKLLGDTRRKLKEYDASIECFKRAAALDPADSDSLYSIASIQANMESKEANESLLRAVKVNPIKKIAAAKSPPDFSLLTIGSPYRCNTPTDYLIENASYEINAFYLIAGEAYDLDRLKKCGIIAFNVIGDADMAQPLLPQAIELADRLSMPVLNHPAKIQKTTRNAIAQLMQEIPDCREVRAARVIRHTAGNPSSAEALEAFVSIQLPLLARPAGTHGGEDFEVIDSFPALEKFIRQKPDIDHYLIEYLDYKSADEHFRKYRFMFIDGKIMPYHLAIGSSWKVHHITTDMDKHPWMQAEEKAFLENPETVFSPAHYEAFRAIHRALGLEYFGIDCGIDRKGNLVIFEVNATMAVHQHNEAFPYKTPFVGKIKLAFNEMLESHVRKIK